MGSVLKISCDSCGKEWQYAVGSGMFLAGREEILHAFSEKERGKVEKRLDACALFDYDFHYQLGICSCCKNVVRVPVLSTFSEGKKDTYAGLCPQCGKQVRVSETAWQAGETCGEACPSCNTRALSVREVGMWD